MAVVPRSSNGVAKLHHCSQHYTRMYSVDERSASGLLIAGEPDEHQLGDGVRFIEAFLLEFGFGAPWLRRGESFVF